MCTDCPELTPTPNEGCLKPTTTECVVYNGDNDTCLEIVEGQNLNEIIEIIASTTCDLQDQIEDINEFSCGSLNTCSINDLGDVNSFPTIGQFLMFNGTNWINQTINPFSCGNLNACSISDLGDVGITNPTIGDTITFNGTEWVSSPQTPGYQFNCNELLNCSIDNLGAGITTINGLHGNGKTSNPVKLGGTLIENTAISGSNFNFILGTSASTIDRFNSFSNILNFKTNLISLNESDQSTQNKGLRFDLMSNSISLGTNVFNNFNFPNINRIGENIQISNTNPIASTAGTFIGKDINVNSSLLYSLGSNITANSIGGIMLGSDLSASNIAGVCFLGNDIIYTAGGTGNQSVYALGSNITVNHQAGVNQGNLIFNPISSTIISSTTGTLNTNDKIRVGTPGKVWTTFNSSGYYLFTEIGNQNGWNSSTRVVKIMRDFIKISQSTGNVPEQEIGSIRYNPTSDKFEGYTTSGWQLFN